MLARQIAIGFGIAIIFPLLIHYGVATFHPAPKIESSIAPLAPNATPDDRKEYFAPAGNSGRKPMARPQRSSPGFW